MKKKDCETLAQAATAFSHPRRVMIFQTLSGERDGLWLETLIERTRLDASTLAHHLRPMEAAGLIARMRRGARVRLVLAPGPLASLEALSGSLSRAIRMRPRPRLATSRGGVVAPEG